MFNIRDKQGDIIHQTSYYNCKIVDLNMDYDEGYKYDMKFTYEDMESLSIEEIMLREKRMKKLKRIIK